jgi:hypothetical protein
MLRRDLAPGLRLHRHEARCGARRAGQLRSGLRACSGDLNGRLAPDLVGVDRPEREVCLVRVPRVRHDSRRDRRARQRYDEREAGHDECGARESQLSVHSSSFLLDVRECRDAL